MLTGLVIRDFLLIEQLTLAPAPGLVVLTGETGAGKSILLDALSLALGQRARGTPVRPGAAEARISAEFLLQAGHPAHALLAEHGLPDEGEHLVLRRVISADGRSRAFVNDQPCGLALLARLGELLVEIHGQFETQSLLDPARHRALLDEFAGLEADAAKLARLWDAARAAAAALDVARAEDEAARRDQAFLTHAVEELDGLAPQPGEEAELAARRAFLLHHEALAGAVAAAAEALDRQLDPALGRALAGLEKQAAHAGGKLDPALARLEAADAELKEAAALLAGLADELAEGPGGLEKLDDRLHALRDLARKHGVPVDGLAALRANLAARLEGLGDAQARIAELAEAADRARAQWRAAAGRLSSARSKAAARLDKAVAAELEPLKLGRARFATSITPLAEERQGAHGLDDIRFEVATNPGAPPGPLDRIASGGELARFMLALKSAIAAGQAAARPVLIFDEVDAGVGGAVAAAVGQRLAKLGQSHQVLAVTHSPQLAARGGQHWLVAKSADGAITATSVAALDPASRKEEIARMLSGAEITDEARAAAARLLEAG